MSQLPSSEVVYCKSVEHDVIVIVRVDGTCRCKWAETHPGYSCCVGCSKNR